MPSDLGKDGDVGAVILAAGASSRMGRDKLLLELGGQSLLSRAIGAAEAAGLWPCVVVTGPSHDAIEVELASADCRLVFNESHAQGIHTSIGAGVAALEAEVRATVVMLADMPWVDAAMLRELADAWRNGAPLVVSRYGGEVEAPPMLYDRKLFAELRLMQRRCGKEVIRRHRDEVVFADWPAARLQDVDTPDDYVRLQAQIGKVADAS